MELITHGGKCCAVRTIHTIGENPESLVPALVLPTHSNFNDIRVKGGAWEYSRAGQRFYQFSAPKEKAVDRLRRYIAYTEKLRPQGMIEVLIAGISDETYAKVPNKSWYDSCDQGRTWPPVLLELGFKEVNRFLNWNTNKTVFVWNRNSGEVPTIEFEEKDAKASIQPKAKLKPHTGDTDTLSDGWTDPVSDTVAF